MQDAFVVRPPSKRLLAKSERMYTRTLLVISSGRTMNPSVHQSVGGGEGPWIA